MNIIDALKTVRFKQEKEMLIPLKTKWEENLDVNHILCEYPRPQMIRQNYTILNGYWNYAFTHLKKRPTQFDGQILVPFSPESRLSQVNRQLQPHEYLWYERSLSMPRQLHKRCLLHFGAVDQKAVIYINHHRIFEHVGGYLPFHIDITDYLNDEQNILTVRVEDDSDTSYHSIGKQRLKRGGMYYTAQSGIWQTVWLEWVDETYIQDVKIQTDLDHQCIYVEIYLSQPTKELSLQINNEEIHSIISLDKHITQTLKIKELKAWSPDSPYLYHLHVKIPHDEVQCYFAMRTFTIENDNQNIPRICLNHQPIFMNGILDQGYWSDGLYTAASDEAMIYDIQTMKSLGFNMIRKHIKIEPSRWYYHCDRLGMIVWQDMVNGGEKYHTWFVTWMPSLISWTKKHISDKHAYLFARQNKNECKEWINECQLTIDHLAHFPCISTWVLFNEGWGQFKTKELTHKIRQLDPARLIDSASGWFDQKCGDIRSEHHYFDKPKMISDQRAFVLSEYGGYIYQVPHHISISKSYGYKTFKSQEDFSLAYYKLFKETVEPLIEKGLCGAVYTQLSDIEEEVNGLLTYDRQICKLKRES